MNWDAAVNQQANTIGIGGIVRDSDGEVLATFRIPQAPAQKPEVAEALALRKSMQVCLEIGLKQVVFEGNCQTVVRAATSTEENRSEIAAILHDIRFLLRQSVDWDIRFTKEDEHDGARVGQESIHHCC